MSDRDCPFCHPPRDRILHEADAFLVLRDAYPVTEGHALVVTRRHVATWPEASEDERAALLRGVEIARAAIEARHRPDGFNIGVNVGEAAGQTVFHLHVHVIPRRRGDVANPRGGVRGVIPAKADYSPAPASLEDTAETYRVGAAARIAPPHERGLVAGESDPLLAHLRSHLARADRLDVAVAFVQRSGVVLLGPHLVALLARGGRLRLVTGDYLDASDPDAMRALLDLATIHPDRTELRVFECGESATFHPKAYLVRDGPRGTAFVGSSNLTGPALTAGLEWSYRVVDARDREGFEAVASAFEDLLEHPATRPLDAAWIERYRARRRVTPFAEAPPGIPIEAPEAPPEPHAVQHEALAALARTRAEGNRAGLVVLATGLGKTWLAAFDASRYEFERVLFVAHREEILAQAAATFRRVRPRWRIGRYTGDAREPEADVVLASVQTLARAEHLRRFEAERFDYIVIDEFHHAHARTYRRLLGHFTPDFLLGLTATPERSDGGDLLALCGENLVYRCDLPEAIRRGLLAPFHYFGVPDEVDYRNIPWRSTRFDEQALTEAVATRRRADNVLEQHRERAGRRTIGFCCSMRHADFMRDHFRAAGLRTASVHSGRASDPRAGSIEQLAAGELDVLFAVDMFNEGLDLPDVDTVMMLRPTESRILWLQQLGRGLRKTEAKDHLTVIDYIGNHRTFLVKPQTLFDLGAGDANVESALAMYERGELDLPPGCDVTYDLRAIEILRGLLRRGSGIERIRQLFEDFRHRHGHRPTAVETFHEGFNPRAVRQAHGSWLDFVASVDGLEESEERVLAHPEAGSFLRVLETTQMARSYKMPLLLAALDAGALPGEVDIAVLVPGVRRVVERSRPLRNDFGEALDSDDGLRRLLERNPIRYLVEARGTAGTPYFAYSGGRFSTTFRIPESLRPAFGELAREIIDWRLAEYLERPSAGTGEWLLNVSQANGRPMIFLPSRETNPGLPGGWTTVLVDGEPHEANFVKVALNVVRRAGADENVLPEILRRWFGVAAGQPGRRDRVRLAKEDRTWTLRSGGST